MADFTFLELHLDDATITNTAPYSGADPSEDETEPAPDEDSRSTLTILAVGLALVALAAIGSRVLLGGEEPIEVP